MIKIFYIVFILLNFFSNTVLSTENQITFDVTNISSTINKTVANNIENRSSIFLLFPIPNKLVLVKSAFFLTVNNKTINANYRIMNTWPTIENEQFIRLLSIEVDLIPSSSISSISSISSSPLTLTWRDSVNELSILEVSAAENINNQLVYPSMSWLMESILLHPAQLVDNAWYIEPQKKYAHYVTNQALLIKEGYPASNASQWLYDRPQAIYQLYLMSAEKEWLVKANELADFYIKNIDENGVFMLKKRFDPKLLMPKGVLYRYLLSGDLAAKEALKRMFTASLDWDETYTLRRGFWTERNQAAALNVAISYWELTNDSGALKRINDIIDTTVAMTFTPENGWSLRGCPQHGFKSHEGRGDDTPTCSPWMMALLADALWRFYQLTGDIRAASLIDAFGDFVLNYGIYYGNARVKNIVIPKYIVSIENTEQERLNQWTDPQHVCDVAALLGKSTYIKQKTNQDSFVVKTLFNALLEQCSGIYTRLKKTRDSKREKNYWVVKPPRRFGWMYSTTSDLPWLKSMLLNDY